MYYSWFFPISSPTNTGDFQNWQSDLGSKGKLLRILTFPKLPFPRTIRKLKSVSFTLSRLLDGALEFLSSDGVMTLLPAGPSLAFWRTYTHIYTQKWESEKSSLSSWQNWLMLDRRWPYLRRHSREKGCITKFAQTQVQRLIPTILLTLLSELKWKTVFMYNQIKADRLIWLSEQNQSKKQSQRKKTKHLYSCQKQA